MNENQSIKSTSSLKYTLLIGLGFMTTGISWSMYNTYVPYMLETTWFFKENSYFLMPALLIIGLIMTFDNVIAWLIQPWIGARSDNTWHSRWGRRIPYLLVGLMLTIINGIIGGPGKEMDFLFLVSISFLFLAFLSMFKVKSGELGQKLED